MKFDIDIYTTHVTINNANEAAVLLERLLDRMIYEDTYAPADGDILKIRGYIFDEENDMLYLHKGVDIEYIRRLLVNIKVTVHDHDEFDIMDFEFEEIIPPRDEYQQDIIDFFKGVNGHPDSFVRNQLLLPAGTGTGKTFTASYAACSLGMKTMIIVHNANLIKQWYNTLVNMHGFPSNRIHLLSTTDMYLAAYNKHECDSDIYIMTHASFRVALKKIQSLEQSKNIFKNLKIGLKIIDECHLEFGNIILIDLLSNVYKSFYLSATPGRSNKDENAIFKYVFSDTLFYRRSLLSSESGLPKKWVSYNTIVVNSELPSNIYRYKIGDGKLMNAVTYGKFVIHRDKKQIHFKCIRDIVRDLFTKDQSAKIVIFLPLIDLTLDMQLFLKTQLSYDETFPYDLNVKTMTSRNSKKENEMARKADVIITTIKSCGVGVDLPGLTGVISASPFASALIAEQVFGRLRYCGKICHYYDIIDSSVPADNYFWKARKKVFDRLALEVHIMDYSDDE